MPPLGVLCPIRRFLRQPHSMKLYCVFLIACTVWTIYSGRGCCFSPLYASDPIAETGYPAPIQFYFQVRPAFAAPDFNITVCSFKQYISAYRTAGYYPFPGFLFSCLFHFPTSFKMCNSLAIRLTRFIKNIPARVRKGKVNGPSLRVTSFSSFFL